MIYVPTNQHIRSCKHPSIKKKYVHPSIIYYRVNNEHKRTQPSNMINRLSPVCSTNFSTRRNSSHAGRVGLPRPGEWRSRDSLAVRAVGIVHDCYAIAACTGSCASRGRDEVRRVFFVYSHHSSATGCDDCLAFVSP
jgi:hypothetical protein